MIEKHGLMSREVLDCQSPKSQGAPVSVSRDPGYELLMDLSTVTTSSAALKAK